MPDEPLSRLVPVEGGPNRVGWVRVGDPPPLALSCEGGAYVLDDGAADDLRYAFVQDVATW